MTVDAIAGLLLGAAGLGATVWAAYDARRQRTNREKAVVAATAVIERTYGLLIGIKPAIKSVSDEHVGAIDNGLSAIDEQREIIKHL